MDILRRANFIEEVCNENNLNNSEKIRKFFNKLSNEDLIILLKLLPNEQYDELFYNPDKITRAILNIDLGAKCNLKCSYCYARQEEKKLQSEIEENVYNSIPNFINKHFADCKNLKVNFLGTGEPFLKPDKLITIIKNINKSCNDKNISFWSCTNGTIEYNDILKEVDTYDFRIGVSLESSKELQDKIRVGSKYVQTGTFNTVKKNIKSILDDDSLSNRVKDIWGLMVVHEETEDLYSALKFFSELGINRVQMKPVRLSNNESLDKHLINIYEKYLLNLQNDIKNNNFEKLKMILNDTDYLGKFIMRILLHEATPKRCGAGSRMISIASDGTIYPCDSMIGIADMKLGNVKNGIENKNITDKFAKETIYNDSDCLKCWGRSICGGKCHYLNLISKESQESECKFKKRLISLAFSLAIDIHKNPNGEKEIIRFAKTMRRIRKNTP